MKDEYQRMIDLFRLLGIVHEAGPCTHDQGQAAGCDAQIECGQTIFYFKSGRFVVLAWDEMGVMEERQG